MKRLLTKRLYVGVVVAAFALLATGCSSTSNGGNDAEGSKTITIGAVEGWNDHLMTAYIYKNVLEKHGYEVDIRNFGDLAPVFAATAKGDVDLTVAQPEGLHKAYYDKYKSQVEVHGSFIDAYGGLYVPDYMSDVKSIADLKTHASEFEGQIYGIEAGSGVVMSTQNKALPDYDLGAAFTVVNSSTPAVLANIKSATEARKPVVATLWTPFWANEAYGLRRLEDPKESFGGASADKIIARGGFSKEYPDVAEMISHYVLSDSQYMKIEDLLTNEYGFDRGEEAVNAWLSDNPDFAENLEKYLKK